MANPHEPHFLKPLLPHEGDMVFHVTPFGPSCCEIQYTHPHIIKEEAEADDAAGDADDNEHHHKIRGTWAMSSFSFDYCFFAEVTASNLKEDKLYLPVGATSSTALNKQCQEMILVNKEGNSWTRCDIGDLFVFNLVGYGKTTPLIKSGESSPLTCLRRP
ncbi:hypothetical protein Bca101_087204 [Brassica carinata]